MLKNTGRLLSLLMILIMCSCRTLMGENTFQSPGGKQIVNAEPAWSPDGITIAFSSNQSENNDIWLVNTDGTNLTNLTSESSTNESSPVWLPNGNQIAFLSDRSGQVNIWQIDKNGSKLFNLSGKDSQLEGKFHSRHSISPDGSLISFSSEDALSSDIIIMSLSNYMTRNLTSDLAEGFTWSTWSPTSSGVAFVSSFGQQTSGIWVQYLEQSIPAKIVSSLQVMTLSWSPSGEQMAFTALVEGELYLHTVNSDGSGLQRLMRGSWPSWTPDGQHIVFESLEDGSSDIWIMDGDGSNPRNLTRDMATEEITPIVSPDGNKIAFVSSDGITQSLWTMEIDGSEIIKLV